MLTHVKAGFSTLGCPQASLDEVYALAQKYGLSWIELRALDGSLDLPAVFEKTYGTPANMAAALAGREACIASLDTSFKLIGSSPDDRAALLAYVPWAEALNIPRLRIFDGGKSGNAAEFDAALATAQWWMDLRRTHGWRTHWMIETHDAFTTTPLIQRLISVLPECPLLWDAHHTWRRGGEDPASTWRAIRDHVAHIHVKDSQPRPSERHPYTYVLPGRGDFPIAPLIDALARDRFIGPVCLEWELLWHPYLPSLEEAIEAAQSTDGWK